jgi:hypothetical protein
MRGRSSQDVTRLGESVLDALSRISDSVASLSLLEFQLVWAQWRPAGIWLPHHDICTTPSSILCSRRRLNNSRLLDGKIVSLSNERACVAILGGTALPESRYMTWNFVCSVE